MSFHLAPPGRSAKRLLLPLALATSLAAFELGCGGNVVVDHGGNGQGGAGGNSTSSSPSMFGTPQVACLLNEGGIEICEQLFNAPASTVSALQSACASTSGGKVIPACASDGLVGCCVLDTPQGKIEECFYSGLGVAQIQQACQGQMGKFSSSP